MAVRIVSEPLISVGIVEEQNLEGRLNGVFSIDGAGPVSGGFSAASHAGRIVLRDGEGHEAARAGSLRIEGGANTTFDLFRVTIGKSFHWERKEDRRYRGNLVLLAGNDGGVSAVNELARRGLPGKRSRLRDERAGPNRVPEVPRDPVEELGPCHTGEKGRAAEDGREPPAGARRDGDRAMVRRGGP